MNNKSKTDYLTLIKETQQFLLNEYSPNQKIVASFDNYNYFKQLVLKKRTQNQQLPQIQTLQNQTHPTQIQTHPAQKSPSNLSPSTVSSFTAPKILSSSTPSSSIPSPLPTAASKIEISTPQLSPQSLPNQVPAPNQIPTPIPITTPTNVTPNPTSNSLPPQKSNSNSNLPHSKNFELQPLELNPSSTSTFPTTSSTPSPNPLFAQEFAHLRDFFQKQFPLLPILDIPLDDAPAKQIANAWKQIQFPTVLLLTFQEKEKPLAFLANIAKAIHLSLAPTQLASAEKIEKENDWESYLHSPALRLIIMGDSSLPLLPELTKFLKEDSKTGKRYLHKTPLLLLPNLSVYLKEPSLKSSLWKTIVDNLTLKKSPF